MNDMLSLSRSSAILSLRSPHLMQPVCSEKSSKLDELLRRRVLAEVRAGREKHGPQMAEHWTSLPVFDIAMNSVLEGAHTERIESRSGAVAVRQLRPNRNSSRSVAARAVSSDTGEWHRKA